MFSHIGKKIKTVALVFFWLGFAAFIAYGIYMMFFNRNYLGMDTTKAILIMLATVAVGFIASWLGSILLYGFGELVDSNQSIAADAKKIRSALTHREPANKQ